MRARLDELLAEVRDPSVIEDALDQLAGALAAQERTTVPSHDEPVTASR
jgi:hypothetical protein